MMSGGSSSNTATTKATRKPNLSLSGSSLPLDVHKDWYRIETRQSGLRCLRLAWRGRALRHHPHLAAWPHLFGAGTEHPNVSCSTWAGAVSVTKGVGSAAR